MDLNATLFYKAKFQITVKAAGDDLLWELVQKIRWWMGGKYGPKSRTYGPEGILDTRMAAWSHFKTGGRLFSTDGTGTLFFESEYFQPENAPEEEYWACQLVENQKSRPGFAPRKWITEIGYEGTARGKATLSLVLSYTDMPGFLGPCEEPPAPSVPKLVRLLAEDAKLVCSIGGQALYLEAQELRPGDFVWFSKLLLDPEREAPIVYLSPSREGAAPLLSPKALAGQVTANALVCYAAYPDADAEMRFCCDDRYFCGDGNVRTYMPHPDPENSGDPARHRYFTPEQLEDLGEVQVLSILRRVLAQDIHFYESMFRLAECRRKKEAEATRLRLEALRAQKDEAVQQGREALHRTEEEMLLDLMAELEKRESAEHNLEDTLLQLQEEREKVHSLSTQLSYCQADALRAQDLDRALAGVHAMATYPKGAMAVADYFVTVFPDKLVFSDEGRRSLDDCTTREDILWEALYHMATTLHDLYADGGVPQIDKEFQNRTGWRLSRGEGSQTRKDNSLMRGYTTVFEGREVDVEAHIANGNKESDPKFLRIYFGFDKKSGKLVIGQCGRHKTNWSTQKIH